MAGRGKKDITGERFGKLVAHTMTNKVRFASTVWLCKCDCGGEREVPLGYLRTGQVTCCSCTHKRVRTKVAVPDVKNPEKRRIMRRIHKQTQGLSAWQWATKFTLENVDMYKELVERETDEADRELMQNELEMWTKAFEYFKENLRAT